MSQGQNKNFWIGVDVAKETFDAALAPEGAAPQDWRALEVRHYQFATKQIAHFAQWVREQEGQCLGICLKSTGIYSHRFARAIAAHGPIDCSIVNPARPLAFARSLGVRDKTDRTDAAVLALFGLVHRPAPTAELSPTRQHLRALWRLREDYLAERDAFRCRIEQCDDARVARELRTTLKHFQTRIERIEAEIQSLVETDERMNQDAQLLATIPGIGRVTAWMLLAELGNLREWKRGELIGYAGLFPRVRESGKSARRPQLARGGGGRIRKGLYLGTCSLRRTHGPLSDFTQRLIDKGKEKMCAIAALMRKLLLVARAVVVSGKPFDPERIGVKYA
jgi:transposase